MSKMLQGGYTTVPVKGDVSLFTQFIDHIMGRHTIEEKKWLVQWIAAPFQKAPLKLSTAVVTYSSTQGTGKTLLGNLIRHVYGLKYSLSVSEEQFRSNFNGASKSTQFVVGDEITGIDSRRITDKLKDMITSDHIMINEKHVSEYKIANRINYYFTTNHADAFYIPPDDRHYFIVGVTEHKIDNAFADKLVDWFKSEKGKAALLHYFLNEVDLSGFNPHAAAPVTFAKLDMMEKMKMSKKSKMLSSDTYDYAKKVCDNAINILNEMYSLLHITAFEEDPTGKGYLATVSNPYTKFNKTLYEVQKASVFFKDHADGMVRSLQRLTTTRPNTSDSESLKVWEIAKEEVLTIIYCDLYDLTEYRIYGSESTCDYNIGVLRELIIRISGDNFKGPLMELHKIIDDLDSLDTMLIDDLGGLGEDENE